jgi:hypothetical protein
MRLHLLRPPHQILQLSTEDVGVLKKTAQQGGTAHNSHKQLHEISKCAACWTQHITTPPHVTTTAKQTGIPRDSYGRIPEKRFADKMLRSRRKNAS